LESLLGIPAVSVPEASSGMEALDLSARNRLRGRITALHLDGIMAEVRLNIGGQELVSVITRSSAERLGLKVGDIVSAVIKSTEVMIGRERSHEGD
jgi:molybdopterin-binding protein